MRLPLKFLPRMGQLVGDVIGSAMILGIGVLFFSDYASPSDFDRYGGLGPWLRAKQR